MKLRWPGFLLIAAILVMWGVSSYEKWLDPVSFPRVSMIFASWMRMGGELIEHMLSLLKMQFGAIEGRDKQERAASPILRGSTLIAMMQAAASGKAIMLLPVEGRCIGRGRGQSLLSERCVLAS